MFLFTLKTLPSYTIYTTQAEFFALEFERSIVEIALWLK